MAQQSLGFDEVVAASGVDQLGKGFSRRVASQAARIQSRLPGNRFEHVVRLAAADVFIHAVARLKNEGVSGRVDTERGEIVRDRLAENLSDSRGQQETPHKSQNAALPGRRRPQLPAPRKPGMNGVVVRQESGFR